MDLFKILYWIFQFFILLVMAKLVGVFYENRRSSYKNLLLSLVALYLGYALCFWLASHFAPDLLQVDVLTLYVQSFLLTLHYDSTVARRFTAAFSTGSILLLSYIIMGGMVVPLLWPHLEVGGEAWTAVSNLLLIPMSLLIAISLERFKGIKKRVPVSRMALAAPLTGLVILLLIIAIPVAASFGIDISQAGATFIVLIFMAWFFFSSLFLYDFMAKKYEEKNKMDLQAQEKEYYYAQCQLMQESMEQVRAARHDIVSHLAALQAFTRRRDLKTAQTYLDGLLSDIEKQEIYSDTGNIAFDSIINYKLRNTKADEVSLDIQVWVPPVLPVEVVDVVTILGNLLENAMDAVKKAEQKEMKLEIKYAKGCLFIKVENTFDGHIQYEENAIVSQKKGEGHGYGMKNIRQSVEKYNGYIKMSHSENTFSTGVFLYVEKEGAAGRGALA